MRLAAFYILLLVFQGLLSSVLAPLPAPDLFLIAVLTLLPRLAPWQLVLAAYGIGLLQDLSGHGTPGLHALALAGGAMAATAISNVLSQSGFAERILTLVAGLAGKWFVMAGLLVWLTGEWSSLGSLPATVLFDSVFTLAAGAWLLGLAAGLQPGGRSLNREVL
ncbi:MAG TPA: hypothetical protein VK092_05505 [Deinococcales bacterium]|nr:hypothetical protein [Deinococcales bacterium]